MVSITQLCWTALLLFFTSVHGLAPPGFEKRVILPRQGTPGGTQCVDFQIGNNPSSSTPNGQVCATVSGGKVTITFPTLPSITYTDLQAWVGCTVPNAQVPGTSPGQYPYKLGSGCTIAPNGHSGTCVADAPACLTCDGTLYIVSHASTSAGTGNGKGTCIKADCSPWFGYWSMKTPCSCVTTNTFPPVSTHSTVHVTTDLPSTSTSCSLSTGEVLVSTSVYETFLASSPTETVTLYEHFLSSTFKDVELPSKACELVVDTVPTTTRVELDATCPYESTPPPTTVTGGC